MIDTLVKVLSIPSRTLSQSSSDDLRRYCEILGIAPSVTGGDSTDRHDMKARLFVAILEYKTRPEYSLPLNLENCNYAYSSREGRPRILPDGIWKSQGKIKHHMIFFRNRINSLRERGWYEGDIEYDGRVDGLYLCCSLEDAPLNPAKLVIDLECGNYGFFIGWETLNEVRHLNAFEDLDQYIIDSFNARGYYEGSAYVWHKQAIYLCCSLTDKPLANL